MSARIRSLRNGLNPIDEASRDDLVIADVVLVSSLDAATTYNWALMYVPEGSVANFAGSTAAVSPGSFTVDKEGPYLIRLVVDAGLPSEDTQYVRLRALTTALGLHLVAAGERRDGSGIIPVDVDLVGWADEQNSNLLALEAAVMGASVAPEVLVFRPGGVASGNVYTDWPTLYAVLVATAGRNKKVVLDDSAGAVNIPAGAYDFTNTILEGGWDPASFRITGPPNIGFVIVTIANGVDIQNVAGIVNIAANVPVGVSTPFSFSSSPHRMFFYNTFFSNDLGASPVFSQASAELDANFHLSRFEGNDDLWSLGAASQVQFFMDGRSEFDPNQVLGPIGSSLHLSYTSGCRASTTQANMAGPITTERRSEAVNVELSTIGMTIVTATEVEGAIGELDAAIVGNYRNQLFPTSDQSQDAVSGTLAVGRFAFNPTDWAATTFYFGAVFSVTNALQTGTVLLYNVTDGEVVTGATLTTSSLPPVKQESAALTVGVAAGNLKNTEKIYEIRLSITGALPTDVINLGTAYMLMM